MQLYSNMFPWTWFGCPLQPQYRWNYYLAIGKDEGQCSFEEQSDQTAYLSDYIL